MKGFTVVLLCVFVAVQAGSIASNSASKALAQKGENPWVVHLRKAQTINGYLETCLGSLIDINWVLTTSSCLWDASFIWHRFGAVEVLHPELVLEQSTANFIIHNAYHPSIGANDIGLVRFARDIVGVPFVSPVRLEGRYGGLSNFATLCTFGEERNQPGERLSCEGIAIRDSGDEITSSDNDLEVSRYDVGAPLVHNAVQVGILADPADRPREQTTFLRIANFHAWIEANTGLDL